ncbi:uncharacterized protein LOC143917181 [Arctopsyche grandis]|uniref:uncharacterized protein LOC143917181 n=1 Tax=Arctopsyche grandis TaxID=121162 RepID=UPI00406D6525
MNLENIIWHSESSLRSVIQLTQKMNSLMCLSFIILLAIITFVHSATVVAKDESSKLREQFTLLSIGSTILKPRECVVEFYDPEKDMWSIFAKIRLETNNDYSPFVFNGKLIIFVGEIGTFEYSNEVVAYDLSKKTSSNLSPMGQKRNNVGIAEIDGYIYVTGGQGDGFSVYNTVERYDPKTDTWVLMAPMLTKRYFHAVNVWEGKMYAAGGLSGGIKSMNSLEIYDPKSNSWTLGTPMAGNRYQFSIVFADGSLFAIGGNWLNMKSPQGERLNLSTQMWSNISNTIENTIWSEAIIFGENIIISANMNNYHELNPKTNEVKAIKSKNIRTKSSKSFLVKKSLVNLVPQVDEKVTNLQ